MQDTPSPFPVLPLLSFLVKPTLGSFTNAQTRGNSGPFAHTSAGQTARTGATDAAMSIGAAWAAGAAGAAGAPDATE